MPADERPAPPALRLLPEPSAAAPTEPTEPTSPCSLLPVPSVVPAPVLTLAPEIAALRQLLRAAVAAAEGEPPRDAYLAATRLADAIARAVRAERALQGEPATALEDLMRDALAELGLGEA